MTSMNSSTPHKPKRVYTRRSSNLHYRRGEDHLQARLTQHQVDEIRRVYFSKNVSQTYLARVFNVSQSLISQIICEKIWRSR